MACRAIVESRAGRVIRAIRDAESRTRFLGYPVESFKLWLFVFSAVVAGVAGALYVPQIGIINPGEFAPINSIEAVIWVAVGGRGTLYGAIAGAVLVNYAKTYLTGAFPEVWLYALGALFVLVTGFHNPAQTPSGGCTSIITFRPACSKCPSVVSASVRWRRSITTKDKQSVRLQFLSGLVR
jgi:urea ABC transporter permease protein UrtC